MEELKQFRMFWAWADEKEEAYCVKWRFRAGTLNQLPSRVITHSNMVNHGTISTDLISLSTTKTKIIIYNYSKTLAGVMLVNMPVGNISVKQRLR